MNSRRLLVIVLAALVTLSACTGVPTRSTPQTVESIGVGQRPFIAGGPKANSPPQEIVQDFLTANVSDPVKHAVAREFLTAAARNRWTDTTVTVIAQERVGTYDESSHSVTVTGRKVGSVDKYGVYTPTLDGTGSGGNAVPFSFTIQTVDGQNRIASLTPGLLVTTAQFQNYFAQRNLYFFDSAGRYLVPDPRYSPLRDANDIGEWMMAQLIQGANPNLAGVVNNDSLAALSQRITVSVTAPVTTVQVPGARQLGADVIDRLAAQVSVMLGRALASNKIELLDGERPVVIPQVGRAEFSASDFTAEQGPASPALAVYYLRDGRIHDEQGRPLSGPLGNGNVLLDSMALSRPAGIDGLAVAGVQGPLDAQRLVIGTQAKGVRTTKVPPGRLTRPAFVQGSRFEVWVGDGSRLYRVVSTDARTSQVTQIQLPSIAGGGRVVAVRPSPDGHRVALVVEGVNNRPQLYVGGVVRAGNTVQVVAPTLISPAATVVSDVAWIDPVKLYAIGYLAQSKDSQVYHTSVDGFGWENRGIGSLSDAPDSITIGDARDGATPWVSADGFVWELNGSQASDTWVSPVGVGQTPGTNPIYLG